MTYIAGHLPPIGQARELFSQFAQILQPTLGILHIPSTRDLVEQTYQSVLESEEPDITNLLLLFSMFAGSALAWTPQLLKKLNATQTEAKAAFMVYTRLAMSILDSPRPLAQSTVALAAMGTLTHVITNSDGYTVKIPLIRIRCLLMARAMQIHRLDTAKSREERRFKGLNMIEIEVQRRIWWHMVASDWLTSFFGGPQEGAYTCQPKHMTVNYPSNVDDESITPTEVLHDLPLSNPTSMSAFIYRVKLADLCREVVDTMPSILLEVQEPEYDVILGLDDKFQNYLKELPVFFRIDPTSIRQSQEVCKGRPDIPSQRISVHSSLHTRLCRLHRPYHLQGMTNSKYHYSRMMCIRSAHTVLELRRSMDDTGTQVGLKPARFWTVMQHVFIAALFLAADVSLNPEAPDVEARKAMVLAAYRTIEKSKEESSALMEGIQRSMRTIVSTLQKQRSQIPGPQPNNSMEMGNDSCVAISETVSNGQTSQRFGDANRVDGDKRAANMQSLSSGYPTSVGDGTQGCSLINEAGAGEENWDGLWSEFLAVAPELDVPQWNSLFDDMDLDFSSNAW